MFDLTEWFLNWSETILAAAGLTGVFWAFFIAQIIPPIPTAFLAVAAGFLILPGEIGRDFWSGLISVAFSASLGVTIGSLFIYYPAYFLGKPFIDYFGKYFRFSWRQVEKIKTSFEKSVWDEIVLFVLRAIPVFPTVIVSLAAGLVRFKIGRYLLFTFLGTFVRILALAVLGWQAGLFYRNYAAVINRLEFFGLAILFFGLLVFFFYYLNKEKRGKTASF